MGYLFEKAVESVLKGENAYCKFLSANDSGETGGHQVGVLISKSAKNMLFTDEEIKNNHIIKRNVSIKWQADFTTTSCFTWYESKNELRITKLGRGFALKGPEYTGALFVLIKQSFDEYEAFLLNTEDDIELFLDTFGLTPAETNRPLQIEKAIKEASEESEIEAFIQTLTEEFPASFDMSLAARIIHNRVYKDSSNIIRDPDKILLLWADEEYRLFRAIENSRYGSIVNNGFKSVDDFIVLANKVLNRRKSRAGKSLEHHLSAIFDGNNIQYTAQGITEGNKRPDFIFPSIEAYHDTLFSVEKLCTLAAKTTCKDRWRQVLNEADRLRDHNKYLCTMQQGISAPQMDEMQAEHVILVVPKPYISSYPRDRQDRIWTIGKFVNYVKEIEGIG